MTTGGGVASGTSYTIGGVKLEFPCKAYPTQLSMMSMIIKGIERHQNCLLESPTGSGKSLALLCSCLAWQQNEYKKRNEEDIQAAAAGQPNECQERYVCTCDCSKTSPKPSTKPCTVTSPPAEDVGARPSSNNGTCQPFNSNGDEAPSTSMTEVIVLDDDDDDSDFKPSKKRYRTPGTSGGASKKIKAAKGVVFEDPSDESSPDAKTNSHTLAHWQMKLPTESATGDSAKSSCPCPCHSSKVKDLEGNQKDFYKSRKIPKIFFGTRTHKQIAQIVRELGKTAYKNVPMCILGSREYTCVHPDVSRSFNKNDGCKELLDGRNGLNCQYFNGAHKMKNQWQLRDRGLTEAWDIEDLVTLGKKIKACPYFAVRSLKDEADIIFCPYNYLIDPIIRMTMDINMKNQIVVLDEAHNIEDSARDAASRSVTAEQLEETVAELDSHIRQQWREYHCRVMHTVSAALLEWVQSHSHKLTQRDFDRALHVWSGAEIVNVLSELGITKDTLGSFQHHLAAILEEAEPIKKDKEDGVTLNHIAGMTLKALFLMFEFLFKADMKYMKDFKVAIVRAAAKSSRFNKTDNRWISKRRSSEVSWTLSLNFWCLNPAVAFTDFGEEVRSIILTSGTLSPMSSFQSELGVAFPIQLEANHVVHTSQVWVGTVAIGTNGGSLNGSYKNAETYSFQDEIGLLLLQVCQVVPYGVLCFLPSYGMMSKLSQRWKNTGLWDQLEKVKVVMSEARGADKVNFDEHLREFYEVIKDCETADIENQSMTGAVFLAVCRGKVSEGMDFADNNARAVMTIGIPFPSIKDTQVELKRQYNDQYSACRGLLTGSEWYEIQAFRAINQALGRCIRHKRDWGALILVDDRFGRCPKKYTTGLSKWVRGKVVHHTHAKNALASLDEFAKARQLSPCPELPSLSMCASPSLANESLNATLMSNKDTAATPTTPAPSTSMATQPCNHSDSGMASALKATALHFQQSQALATPNPATPNLATPNPATPNLATPNLATPNLATPNLATPTALKFFSSSTAPSSPYAFGSSARMTKPLNAAHGTDTNQKLVALQPHSVLQTNLVPGRLVENGKKILGNQGDVMPAQNQTVIQQDSVKTPRGKLDFEEVVTIDHDSPRKEASQTDCVHQRDAYRTECDNTPLLFDSDEEGVEDSSPCRTVTNRGLPDSTLGSSTSEVKGGNNVKDNKEDVSGAPHRQATPVENVRSSDANSPRPDSKSTQRNRASAKEAKPTNADHEETDEPGRQTRSRDKMMLRRSSRSRRRSEGACCNAKADGDHGDFLDNIADNGNNQKQAMCRPGLFCAICNCCFTENLDEVSRVSGNKTYLVDQSKLTNSRTRNLGRTAGRFCQCPGRDVTAEEKKRRQPVDTRFYRISAVSSLTNIVTEGESSLRSQRDCALNAHWSDKDQCCYQPITCAVCQTKRNASPTVIGYKLVAVGQHHDNSCCPGSVWLFPKDVAHCCGFTAKNESE